MSEIVRTTIRLPQEVIEVLDSQATAWFTTRNQTIFRIIYEWQKLKEENPHAKTCNARQNMGQN